MKRLIISILIVAMVGASLLSCKKDSESVNSSTKTEKKISVTTEKESVVKEEKSKEEVKESIEIKVNVTSKTVTEETESLSVDLQLPDINGHVDKELETKLNELLQTEALKIKASLTEEAKTALQDSKSYDVKFRKYVLNSSYKVSYNKNEYLSIVNYYDIYTGGAHGMRYMKSHNIDLKTGKDYNLSEIFNKGYDYKKVIDGIILNEMTANKDQYFEESITNFKGIEMNHPYYVEAGNLVVYFTEYELAPYAHGIPEFKVPLSKLEFNKEVNIQ